MATTFSAPILNKALTVPFKVRKVTANQFRVANETPDEEHGEYDVFWTVDKKGQPEIIRCRNTRNKRCCKGFEFNGGSCVHGACVCIRVLTPQLRKKGYR